MGGDSGRILATIAVTAAAAAAVYFTGGAILAAGGWGTAYTLGVGYSLTAAGSAAAAGVGMGVMAAGTFATQAMLGSPAIPETSFDAPSFGTGFERGILLNKAGNNEPLPVIYGTRRVGGVRVFIETTGDKNEYLHLVIVLCEGEIQAIDTVYLDGVATSDSRFSGLVNVYKHLGPDSQTADSNLVSAVTAWTTAHRLRGTAYVYLRLKFDRDAFHGMPTITCDVRGKKVWDPRDSTTKFSANPALCIRNYLTNERYGRGIPESMIDDTLGNAAANYCDENVTVCGNSQDRYTCDGIVDTSLSSLSIVQKMLTSCRAAMVFSGGKYQIKIDKPESATFTFDEDNICGAWSIAMGDKKNTFNRMRANYFNPDRSWQPDIVPVDSSVYRAEDNEVLLEREIELPFTADFGTAKQIATINLKQSRQQIACEFTATVEGLQCEVFDVVKITHATPGWDEKKFRILAMSLQNNDEVRVSAMEYDADAYDFGTIDVPDTTPNTNLPDPFSVAVPTNLEVEENTYSTRGGGLKAKATLTCEKGDDLTIQFEWGYKLSADADWIVGGLSANESFILYDMAVGVYDFRVRGKNGVGVSSDYCTIYSQEIQGLAAAPVDVTGFSGFALVNQFHASWNKATDADVLRGGRMRFRHSPLMSGATWGNANDIVTAIPGTATSGVLPLISGTYLVKFVDSLGVESANAVSIVTNVPDVIRMNAILTSTQNPTFPGTKTSMSVSGGYLKFVTPIPPEGSYIFKEGANEYVDLGAVFNSRVTTSCTFTVNDLSNLIDDRAGNMDDWIEFDDSGDFSDVQADIYVATTDDDPSGTPTWSAWVKCPVGDFKCRAFKFKLVATNDDSNHQIQISALFVKIDMPDKVQSARNVSVAAGGTNISYPTAFKAVPELGVTVMNMVSGDYLIVTAEATTGFTVQVKDNGNNGVARTINWMSRGYY